MTMIYSQVAHSITLSLSLPLSSPKIVTARIVTSQQSCFVGRLSKKKQTNYCCILLLILLFISWLYVFVLWSWTYLLQVIVGACHCFYKILMRLWMQPRKLQLAQVPLKTRPIYLRGWPHSFVQCFLFSLSSDHVRTSFELFQPQLRPGQVGVLASFWSLSGIGPRFWRWCGGSMTWCRCCSRRNTCKNQIYSLYKIKNLTFPHTLYPVCHSLTNV